MKTTHNAFALLFAAITFTACTHQSIEPVRPVYQTQPIIRTDSIESVHILPNKTEQDARPVYYGLETVDQEPGHMPYQQPHTVTPSPQPIPRETVMPVVKSDSLAQY